MNKRRGYAAAAIAVLAITSLVACAGGGESEESGAAGSAEPIKLGVMTAVGSPVTNYPDIEVAAQAAAASINKAGGVNGADVEIVFCNTRGEANQAIACARELDEEGVVATVGRVDIFAAQSFPVLEAAGIPDIGTVSTGAEIDFTSPMSFPLHGGNFGAYTALPYAFQEDGDSSMVVATIDLPVGTVQGEYAETVAEDIGLDVKPMIKIPAQGVTDYSPYVQQVADLDVDSAIVMLGPAGFQAFVKAAAGLGLDARIAGTAFTFGQSEAAGVAALADDMLVTSPLPSIDERDIEGIAKYHAELDEAGVGDDVSLRRLAGLNAWLAVHAAAEVAATIDGPVTRESMIEALESTTGLDLFGLIEYSPAELTSDIESDHFARFPKVGYHALTFQSPQMIETGLPLMEDPLAPVR